MSRKLAKRLTLDLLMLILVLLEYAYPLTGDWLHEGIGLSLLLLFGGHLLLNKGWFTNLRQNRYRGLRLAINRVNLALLLIAGLLLISGLLNSVVLFELFGLSAELLPRQVHTAAAHWFLLILGLHLGLHWTLILNTMPPMRSLSRLPQLAVPAASLVCGWGLYAFFNRQFPAKLVAYYSFNDWDFQHEVLLFFLHYLAITGLVAAGAHLCLKRRQTSRRLPRQTGRQSLHSPPSTQDPLER